MITRNTLASKSSEKKTAVAGKKRSITAPIKEKVLPIIKRPPVVVVLGHVDHGKSSLLEAIKDFNITSKESGGITQHIGAYEVEHNNHKITFIDTPGHEAFSAMRSRGAEVADIALLVIDAAQSVQPQTKEAITVIKKTEIPMIVVLNKIDMPTADPEKIKRELLKIDVAVESMSGSIPSVEVSTKEKTGINELLEMILLVADLHDLRADIDGPVEGLIIESYIDKFKGPIANVIVEKGILKKKDIVATDSALAKIKSIEDFTGKLIEKAFPGSPAVILGFETVPGIGEKFKIYPTAEEAVLNINKGKIIKKDNDDSLKINSNQLAPLSAEGQDKRFLNIILKGDVLGSLDAIKEMIKNLPQDKVFLRIIKSEAGDISESDAKFAQTSNSQIMGFRVKISPEVMQFMKNDTKKRVKIKNFDVIYDLVQEIRNGMEKSLEAETIRKELGKIKALIIFFAEKNRQIVGGKITEGEIKKGLKLEVFRSSHGSSNGSRNEEKIGAGRIINLQRDKKDIEKLSKGDECGILFEGNVKIEKGDILVAFTEEKQKASL